MYNFALKDNNLRENTYDGLTRDSATSRTMEDVLREAGINQSSIDMETFECQQLDLRDRLINTYHGFINDHSLT